MGNLYSTLGQGDLKELYEQAVMNSDVMGLPRPAIYKILSHLDYENLKNCRLVCDRWEKILRNDYFTEDYICCRYPPLIPAIPFENSKQKQIRKSFRTFLRTKGRRLKFSTLRLALPLEHLRDFRRDLLVSDVPLLDGFKEDMYKLRSSLKRVIRLEIISISTVLALKEYDKQKNTYYVLLILKDFKNLRELIVSDVEDIFVSHFLQNMFTHTDQIINYGHLFPKQYQPSEFIKLKKLKKLVYSLDIFLSEVDDYFDFLRVMANTCEELIEFEIRIDYSYIWSNGLALENLYELLGILLKRNAATLKTVYIGVRNVLYCDDQLITNDRTGGPLDRVGTDLLRHGNRPDNYLTFSRNEMFERLFDEMRKNKWEDFGLNVLESLTLEFPLPVLSSPNINLGLKPFIDSIGSLKSLKIHPIIATEKNTQYGTVREPMPYLADIFSNNSTRKSNITSDIIFFEKLSSSNVSWSSLQSDNNLWDSAVDLVFKKKPGELKERNIRWRKVSWQYENFQNSMIVQHFRHLTRLVISQNNSSCPRQTILSINDADFQLIIREGKSLQCLILNCDLGNITPFGFSGLRLHNISTLQIVMDMGKSGHNILRKSKTGYSILDLKALECLILTGLRGNYLECACMKWKSRNHTSEKLKLSNFSFLLKYLSNSNQVKYLILGFEEFTSLRRIDEFGQLHVSAL